MIEYLVRWQSTDCEDNEFSTQSWSDATAMMQHVHDNGYSGMLFRRELARLCNFDVNGRVYNINDDHPNIEILNGLELRN